MHEVEFRQRAVLDLRSIQLHYLTTASEQAAQKHLDCILAGVELVRTLPDIGSRIDDPRGIIPVGYRRHLAGGFWIYYSASLAKITVWRVFHSKQEIDDQAFVDL
ncbi:MAG: type II toxin-antitoxin system RelE/ParE family toxin [Coriobacteriia bacterium]|nr:type II toxin-antitoxin system RelE/ParE family toxin [Coriobacteriia bacterium]